MEELLGEKRLAVEEIGRLKEKLREAEAKNNRDSSDSNKPSSRDHFDKPKPSPKKSTSGHPTGSLTGTIRRGMHSAWPIWTGSFKTS